jgi:competence protein ComEC
MLLLPVIPIVGFAAGVLILQQQAQLPNLSGAYGLVLAAVVLSACWRRWPHGVAWQHIRYGLLCLMCLAAGFLWAAANATWRMADALPAISEGRDITVIGVVSNLPQAYGRSLRFEFDVEQVLTAGYQVPSRIVLSWWSSSALEPQQGFVSIKPGERWRFTVRLKRPHGLVNPHGFDYEVMLLERGIRATGYVRPKSSAERLSSLVPAPTYWIGWVRGQMRERIERVLGDAPTTGVIAALAMGDQRGIPPEQWQIFTRTGVNHLISISGLHVTMFSGLIFWLVNWAWRRSRRLVLLLPATKAAAVAGLLAALCYALLAGFAVPAQRTVWMLAVVAVALWSGRMASSAQVLASALWVVLLIDPWAVLAPGFWLSFGAVAIIMWVTVQRLHSPVWWMAWGQVQWAVTIALVPALLLMFQQVSIISPIVNAVAIPVVSWAVVPLALGGLIVPLDGLLQVAQWLMTQLTDLLGWASTLPEAAWQQHSPPTWTVVVAGFGALWMLLPRGFPARWLGALTFLPMLCILPPVPAPGHAALTVLDVGQGLSIVIQTHSHTLVFDTGPAFGVGADSGTRVLIPYLRAQGIRRIDSLILSHDDADHTGGALSLLQAVPVSSVLSSLPDWDPALLLIGREHHCAAGQSWQWDGVLFEILYPESGHWDQPRLKDNERSCVLKVSAAGGSVLIPADIERRGERYLLAHASGQISADLLIAPHQGSRTSSSWDFVMGVAPQAVIFPVGYRNRFGHPHPEIQARYAALGVESYRTDDSGAILVSIKERITIRRQRLLQARYWQDLPAGVDDELMVPAY